MAITHEDVSMLQNAIQSTGQGALQRRKLNQEHDAEMQRLALEGQLRDVQESRYDAQQAHFNKMEAGQQDAATKQQTAQQVQSKQELFKSIAALNATGALTDAARKQFNDFLAKDEHFGPTGIQIQPPDPKLLKSGNKASALAANLQTAQSYRQQAEDTDDPDEKTQFTHYADILEKASEHATKFASEVPKQGSTTENEFDKLGHKIKSTTTPLAPPNPAAAAPIPGAPMPQSFGAGGFSADEPDAAAPPPPVLPDAVQQALSQKPVPEGGGLPIATTATPETGKVRVRHPNGQTGLIPAIQLPQAIQQGFKPIDDATDN